MVFAPGKHICARVQPQPQAFHILAHMQHIEDALNYFLTLLPVNAGITMEVIKQDLRTPNPDTFVVLDRLFSDAFANADDDVWVGVAANVKRNLVEWAAMDVQQ